MMEPVVVQTIEQYLKPAIVGRYADDINDIWQMAWYAPYWRASVVIRPLRHAYRVGRVD